MQFFDWFEENFNNLPAGWGDLLLSIDDYGALIDKNGDVVTLSQAPLITENDFKRLIDYQTRQNVNDRFTLEEFYANAYKEREADFAALICDHRFRVNLFTYEGGKLAAACRKINNEIFDIEKIGLPINYIKELFRTKSGIVLFAGETGAGKSSTLAAGIQYLQQFPLHIVTIEDPIEATYKKIGQALVHQREVGADSNSFYSALRAALRQKPHVIMIGEIRDALTAEAAMKAAISGHLVLSTVHSNSSYECPRRIVDLFPVEQQQSVRNMLADCFVAFIAQKLARRKDGSGRVLVYEILNNKIPSGGVAADIKNGEYAALVNHMTHSNDITQMIVLEKLLMNYVRDGIITEEEAMVHANDKSRLQKYLTMPDPSAKTSEGGARVPLGRKL